MNNEDIKVYAFSSAALGFSISDIEIALKIILLLASIGYTIQRWWVLRKQQNQNKEQ